MIVSTQRQMTTKKRSLPTMAITSTTSPTMQASLAAARDATTAPPTSEANSAAAAASATTTVAMAGSSLLSLSSSLSPAAAAAVAQPCPRSCSSSVMSQQPHRKRRRRSRKNCYLPETSLHHHLHNNNKKNDYSLNAGCDDRVADGDDDDGNHAGEVSSFDVTRTHRKPWRNDHKHHNALLWREWMMNHNNTMTRSHPCLLAQRQVGLWPKSAAYAWQCRMLWTTTTNMTTSMCATNKNHRDSRFFSSQKQKREDQDYDYNYDYDNYNDVYDKEEDASFLLSDPLAAAVAATSTTEPMTTAPPPARYDFASYATRRILFTALKTPVQEALLGLERTGSYVVCLGSGNDDAMEQQPHPDLGNHHHNRTGGTGRPGEANKVWPDLYLRFYGMCMYARVRWYHY